MTQDLYIHEMEDFRHIDRVLFLDIDTLWLDDPRGWWSLFEDVRAREALFGLAEEGGNWYAGREEILPCPSRHVTQLIAQLQHR